jgi:uncharacterized protein
VLVCHLGLVLDDAPVVLPTGYGRDRDTVYLHGSSAAASLLAASRGAPPCVTVTRLDGVVYARSAFHHSLLNYASAVIHGTARKVTDVAAAQAWDGVLPLIPQWGAPVPCPRLPPNTPVPPHIARR